MLTFSDVINNDATLAAYKAAAAKLQQENTQLRDDSTAIAAEDFVNELKSKNEAFTFEALDARGFGYKTYYDHRDGNKVISFDYEGKRVSTMRATINLGLGTLTTELYFVQSEQWYDEDYKTTYGTREITPIVESKINVATTTEVCGGKYDSMQSLNDNMGNLINQLNSALNGLNEIELMQQLHKHFSEYNSAQADFKVQFGGLNELARKRRDKVMTELVAQRDLLIDEIKGKYATGWAKKDAEQFFKGELSWGVTKDYDGGYKLNEWNNRHTINSMFENFDHDDVTIFVAPPKRKNSKNLDVTYLINGEDYIQNVVLEREDFYRGLRCACEHLVVGMNFDINVKENK